MALKKQDVQAVVGDFRLDTEWPSSVDPEDILRLALPLLKALLGRLSWWRRLVFGAKALIGVIDDFLEEIIE